MYCDGEEEISAEFWGAKYLGKRIMSRKRRRNQQMKKQIF
jgi:hypothetical protein